MIPARLRGRIDLIINGSFWSRAAAARIDDRDSESANRSVPNRIGAWASALAR